MRFEYNAAFVGVSYKAGGFSGNLGAMGAAFPGSALAACSFDAQGRYFALWLYDDQGQTYERRYPFETIPIEYGGPDRIARIDATGSPSVVCHDRVVKVMFAMYRDGPEPEQLFRFNTGYRLVP